MSLRLYLFVFSLTFLVCPLTAIRCMCSSEAGGIPCYNDWCEVKKFQGKVGACAVARSGSKQHFACVRVKESSEDECKVDTASDGTRTVRCWCKSEDYCNTDLAERIDDEGQLITSSSEDSPPPPVEPPRPPPPHQSHHSLIPSDEDFDIKQEYDDSQDLEYPPHNPHRYPPLSQVIPTTAVVQTTKREDELLWEREEAERIRLLMISKEKEETERRRAEEHRRREHEKRREDERKRVTERKRLEDESRQREAQKIRDSEERRQLEERRRGHEERKRVEEEKRRREAEEEAERKREEEEEKKLLEEEKHREEERRKIAEEQRKRADAIWKKAEDEKRQKEAEREQRKKEEARVRLEQREREEERAMLSAGLFPKSNSQTHQMKSQVDNKYSYSENDAVYPNPPLYPPQPRPAFNQNHWQSSNSNPGRRPEIAPPPTTTTTSTTTTTTSTTTTTTPTTTTTTTQPRLRSPAAVRPPPVWNGSPRYRPLDLNEYYRPAPTVSSNGFGIIKVSSYITDHSSTTTEQTTTTEKETTTTRKSSTTTTTTTPTTTTEEETTTTTRPSTTTRKWTIRTKARTSTAKVPYTVPPVVVPSSPTSVVHMHTHTIPKNALDEVAQAKSYGSLSQVLAVVVPIIVLLL